MIEPSLRSRGAICRTARRFVPVGTTIPVSPEESQVGLAVAFHPEDLPPLMDKWLEMLLRENQAR